MTEPLQILLIDDDEDDRRFFAEAVKEVDDDQVCNTFPDARSALKYITDENEPVPTHIFLDLRMPGISGRKCLQMLRSIDRIAHVPIIIYTTSNDVQDEKELLEMGASHFTTKPGNPDEIYYMISVVINEKWDI